MKLKRRDSYRKKGLFDRGCGIGGCGSLATWSGSEGRNPEELKFAVYANPDNGGQKRYCHCGRGSGSAQGWIGHVQHRQSNAAPEHLQEGKDRSKRELLA